VELIPKKKLGKELAFFGIAGTERGKAAQIKN